MYCSVVSVVWEDGVWDAAFDADPLFFLTAEMPYYTILAQNLLIPMIKSEEGDVCLSIFLECCQQGGPELLVVYVGKE